MNVMNVSGLAAVLFVLVFFFFMFQLYSIDRTRYRSVDQVFASSATAHPKANSEDAMVVAISRDGKMFFSSEQVSLDRLRDLIRERVAEGSEKRVYLNVDKRVSYGFVDGVTSTVRSAGVEQITFLTAEQKPTQPR